MAAKGLQLRLTPLAESDFEDIWRYTFEHWSIDQADRYHRDLVSTMEALARGGKAGRVCSVRDGYRQYGARRQSGVAPTSGCRPSPVSGRLAGA